MAKKKQTSKKGKPGPGRPKGSPNKVTSDVRACVQKIAENLAPEVESWIRRAARRSPLGAAKVMLGLLEFTVPKLARVEHVGDDLPLFTGRVVWTIDKGPAGEDAKGT